MHILQTIMSSPIPPDPYEALGVSKDADVSAIRTAHRKLVLKHHPDRIQDPALKEQGKNAFQKIQQAYEILSDPIRRSRYDDKIKLAELRKEAMMRDPTPRPQGYPSRHAAPAASSREWNSDDQTFYEFRKPREPSYFDSKEKLYDEPQRASSRKYDDYQRSASSKKSSTELPRAEKAKQSPAGQKWAATFAAVNVGIKIKQEADRRRDVKAKEQETRDREKRQARQDKSTRRAYVVSEEDDSDNQSRVTSSTIRPSKPTSRHSRDEPRRSSGHTRHQSFDDDSDQESTISTSKWEGHHGKTMEYIQKAAAAAGAGRPSFGRGESFWSKAENERRPNSSRGRHEYDEPPPRPSMPTQNSAPGGLKSRVDEARGTKEPRRSATGTYPIREKEDYRKEMGGGVPSMHRANTMPVPKLSKKDAAPSKSSNLKHTETHDSGYGSSSVPHTPEMREESPSRRSKATKTKYQIVDPDSDDDDRTQVRRVDSDSDRRRRRERSPDTVIRESGGRREKERSDRPERPKLDGRSKTTREALSEHPKLRRSETERNGSRGGTPNLSRHSSAREKLAYELSDSDGIRDRSDRSDRERDRGERESARYKYPAGEKINQRDQYPEPKYANYQQRDSADRRGHDHHPGSHFQEGLRSGYSSSRRPSVY